MPPEIENLIASLRAELGDLGPLTKKILQEHRSHFESQYEEAQQNGKPGELVDVKLIDVYGDPKVLVALEQESLRKRLLAESFAFSFRDANVFTLPLLCAIAVLSLAPQGRLQGWEIAVLPQLLTLSISTLLSALLVFLTIGLGGVVLQRFRLSHDMFARVSNGLNLVATFTGFFTVLVMIGTSLCFDFAFIAHHCSLVVFVVFSVGYLASGLCLWIALTRMAWAISQAMRLHGYVRYTATVAARP